MSQRRRRTIELLAASGLAAVALGAYITLGACSDEVPTAESCDNGKDDDLDNATDCDDADCIDWPACSMPPDGDVDVDADLDADGDAEVDGDADEVEDGDEAPCEPGSASCEPTCERDEDCALALDMVDCCGGYPHRAGGEVVVCPTAAPVAFVDALVCLLPWTAGDPIPAVPAACDPYCLGVECAACTLPAGAVCHEHRCVPLATDGCVRDDDCADGSSCLDADGDGAKECVVGLHECAADDECLEAHPDCSSCICDDGDADRLRECRCFECGAGTCFVDTECAPHEFCVDNLCTFQDEDACRVPPFGDDCHACEQCRPESAGATRGTCVPVSGGDCD